MADYTRQINTVVRQMQNKGQSVTITKHTSGSYDPATGTTAITETSETAYGITLAYQAVEVDGEVIKSTDLKLLLSTKKTDDTTLTEPQINDQVTVASGTYTIKFVNHIAPSGDVIMYKCQLRS